MELRGAAHWDAQNESRPPTEVLGVPEVIGTIGVPELDGLLTRWGRIRRFGHRMLAFASPTAQHTTRATRATSMTTASGSPQHHPKLPPELADPIGAGLDGLIQPALGADYPQFETCWSPNSDVPTLADLRRLYARDPDAYTYWAKHYRAKRLDESPVPSDADLN